jgi:hypothetical protein
MNSMSAKAHKPEAARQLIARVQVLQNACDLDVLVFLHRHPRTLLTIEQLAAFVGYEMKQVAKTIDALIDGGLLERTQNPMHAARMYLLVLNGPQGGGIKSLLDLASTRRGRHEILQLLATPGKSDSTHDIVQQRRRLHAIA